MLQISSKNHDYQDIPDRCCHDNGGEFVGWEFQYLLHRLGIKDVPTLPYNPQANGIVERMHGTLGGMLRSYIHGDEMPSTLTDAKRIADNALLTASHSLWSNVHSVALAFHLICY